MMRCAALHWLERKEAVCYVRTYDAIPRLAHEEELWVWGIWVQGVMKWDYRLFGPTKHCVLMSIE